MKRLSLMLSLIVLLAPGLPAQYRDLRQLLDEFQATLQWDPVTEQGNIDLSQGDRIIFRMGFPWVVVNYRYQVYFPGIIRRQGAILFPDQSVETLKAFFSSLAARAGQPRVAVILIDAGHGGTDSGAIGYYWVEKEQKQIQEKDVVLSVAKKLHQLLVQEYLGKKILLTRSEDVYLKLEERTAQANTTPLGEYEAIIFISIHANASFNTGARGYEVWVLPGDYRRDLLDSTALDEETKSIAPILNVLLEEEYSIESLTLAKAVLDGFDRLVGELSQNRGIREESWFVVRKAKMPSILLELGFVTNAEEAQLLAQDAYLQKLAQGIYTGLQRFIHAFERTKGFTE